MGASGGLSNGFDLREPDAEGEYAGGYGDLDVPFGASGEYSGYSPYSGSPQPYAQNAPEYVPPLTAKTPAAPPSSTGWNQPAPSYDPAADAYGSHGAGYVPPSDLSRGPASLAHAEISSSVVHAGEYVPGGSGQPLGVSAPEPLYSSEAGRAPYYWDQVERPRPVSLVARGARWAMTLALLCVSVFSFAYAGVSVYAASNLVYAPQVVATSTPADYKLAYQNISFVSRTDHVELQGWFIPGVTSKGALTDTRTIIVVHGTRENRADPGMGLLPLSAALAKHGFAVLAFDMRGSGLSQAAPLSLGYYEQRDVLGAVDFLLNGAMPYPKLGRPKVIGGWGVSMGAATLLLAAAQEPAIHAVVADSAYTDALPLLEREIPKRSGLPSWFTPGVLRAAQTLYAIDFTAVHPVDVVAKIAPRPILFIQGAADTYVPTSDMTALAQAAQQGSGAQVSTWLVPKAAHAQAYHVAGQAYVDKVVAFFTANLPVA